jgi:two-component system chemotaxis response regulator CheB
VAGLYEIKRRGGVAVVQTPGEAEAPEMPRSALENVAVDYCLPAAEMPRLLSQLARELATQQVPDMVKSQQQLGQPAAQTCPECGGAMREEMLGSITRFRCHIGHVMTGEVLASTQLNAMQQNSAAGLRFLNERVALCLRMAAKARAAGHEQEALHWQNAAAQAEAREKTAQDREAEDWIRPEGAEAEEA